jgi:conjugal transfer/type IV secretion protein DotA/TraY
MIKWLRKCGALIAIAFVLYAAPPQEAMASSSVDSAHAVSVIKNIMERPYDATDLAHKSLVRLFGGFIFKPFGGEPGDAPTALAHVLGYTNIIAMILGVVIMAYVILAGALNTAASGEMLGRSWSSVWLPLRTSVAFGMIVPATSGGEVFSVAQSLVIWMIIVGSNSATWLWKEGVAALNAGAPVFASQNYHDTLQSNKAIQAVACAGIRSQLMTKRQNGVVPNAGYLTNAYTLRGANTVTYKAFKYSEIGSLDLSKTTKIKLSDCGEIVLPTSNAMLTNTSLDSAVVGEGAKENSVTDWQQAVQRKFDDSSRTRLPAFLAKAKSFTDSFLATGLNQKNIDASNSLGEAEMKVVNDNIKALADDYGTVIVAYEQYLTAVQNDVLAAARGSDYGANMTKGGWMRAGVWFFETSRLQGFVQTMMTGLQTSSSESGDAIGCVTSIAKFTNCKEQKLEYTSYWDALKRLSTETQNSASTARAASSKGGMALTVNKTVEGKTVETMDSSFFDAVSKNISSTFLNSIMEMGADNAKGLAGEAGGSPATSATGMISPFTAVTSLGRGLQQISVAMWTAGFAASVLLGMSGSTWGAISDFFSGSTSSAVMGGLKYIMATLIPVLSGVGALAFMLAFAIPFMPVTVWIMLVCGYLVTVIEAVAAAPLAVIMLATPEGEGLAGGNFKQALQMVNAIILRPSLSVVGLFAAITLSYVGFAILNDLFWSVAGMTTGAGLFEVLALIFIYSTLAFKLCEYMVQVIHKIPDQIMQWMGGGMQREFGERAGSDVVGSVTQNSAIGGIAGIQGLKTAGDIVSKKGAGKGGRGGGGAGAGAGAGAGGAGPGAGAGAAGA